MPIGDLFKLLGSAIAIMVAGLICALIMAVWISGTLAWRVVMLPQFLLYRMGIWSKS